MAKKTLANHRTLLLLLLEQVQKVTYKLAALLAMTNFRNL